MLSTRPTCYKTLFVPEPSIIFSVLCDYCYNLGWSNKVKKESYIGFIQEKFLVQYIYLIYTRLIVCATWVSVYLKGHIYYMLLIYSIILLF